MFFVVMFVVSSCRRVVTPQPERRLSSLANSVLFNQQTSDAGHKLQPFSEDSAVRSPRWYHCPGERKSHGLDKCKGFTIFQNSPTAALLPAEQHYNEHYYRLSSSELFGFFLLASYLFPLRLMTSRPKGPNTRRDRPFDFCGRRDPFARHAVLQSSVSWSATWHGLFNQRAPMYSLSYSRFFIACM